MAHDTYISPFQTRYASKEMQYIFSEDNKFKTWRRLWIALAKAEQKQDTFAQFYRYVPHNSIHHAHKVSSTSERDT